MNTDEFSVFLARFCIESYGDGAQDTEAAIYRRLYDDFNFDNDMIEKLKKGVNDDLNAINQKYITAEEIINGLINEGLTSLEK